MNVYRVYDGLIHTCWQAVNPVAALEVAAAAYVNEEPRAKGRRARDMQRRKYLARVRMVELVGNLKNAV